MDLPLWIINVGQWFLDTAVWWTTGIFGVCVYWLPVVILLVHYSMRSWAEIQEDRREVEKHNVKIKLWKQAGGKSEDEPNYYYHTHTTIGRMLGRYFVAFVPVVNLCLALFDAMGEIMDKVGKRIRAIFNIDIVSKPKTK